MSDIYQSTEERGTRYEALPGFRPRSSRRNRGQSCFGSVLGWALLGLSLVGIAAMLAWTLGAP